MRPRRRCALQSNMPTAQRQASEQQAHEIVPQRPAAARWPAVPPGSVLLRKRSLRGRGFPESQLETTRGLAYAEGAGNPAARRCNAATGVARTPVPLQLSERSPAQLSRRRIRAPVGGPPSRFASLRWRRLRCAGRRFRKVTSLLRQGPFSVPESGQGGGLITLWVFQQENRSLQTTGRSIVGRAQVPCRRRPSNDVSGLPGKHRVRPEALADSARAIPGGKGHAFCGADGPELLAKDAVRLDRIPAVEQSAQRRAGKSPLRLLYSALWAHRSKRDGLMHRTALAPLVIAARNMSRCCRHRVLPRPKRRFAVRDRVLRTARRVLLHVVDSQVAHAAFAKFIGNGQHFPLGKPLEGLFECLGTSGGAARSVTQRL